MNALRDYDLIILGQGLAGSALAWEALFHGQTPLLIDRQESVTSSRIAAGLMTPLTGKRFAIPWRFPEMIETALAFYRRIEQQTETRFLRQHNYLRLFRSDREREFFRTRRLPELVGWNLELLTERDEQLTNLAAPFGGFCLNEVAQLDAARFLEVTRNHFQSRGLFQPAELDWHQDIQLKNKGVEIPRLGGRAPRLIFCCGAADRFNPWFSGLRFLPAKGEMLTLASDHPSLTKNCRILSRGIWVAPLDGNQFRLGATYDSQRLDQTPTAAGRAWLEGQWLDLLPGVDLEVTSHQAAIRPALFDQKPVLGCHPTTPQLGILNGLGSKGSCQAPWLARHFLDHLETGVPLLPEVSLSRKGLGCQL